MKKLFIYFSIIGIILFYNCSKREKSVSDNQLGSEEIFNETAENVLSEFISYNENLFKKHKSTIYS